MITHKRNLSIEVGDDSSIIVEIDLPFHWVIVFVAAISRRMNMWELSVQLGRRIRINDGEGLLEGIYAVQQLFYHWGPVIQPADEDASKEPGEEVTNLGSDIIDIIWGEPDADSDTQLDDNTLATIENLCARNFNQAWDIGSPQPNSPDVLFQVRLVMDDIDDFGQALPY